MITDKRVFAAVHALIEHQGKYLFIKQVVLGKHEFWDLPGGKVDFGESPYDTLKREVKEEVNVEVEIHEPLGMWWFTRLNDGNQVVSTVFRCTPVSTNIALDQNPTGENIQEFGWLTMEEYVTGGYQPSHASLLNVIRSRQPAAL